MKISLKDWLELEKRAAVARAALANLNRFADSLFLDLHGAHGFEREAALLHKIADRVWDTQWHLNAHAFHVQSEWTGGDSRDPKNFTLREPNWVTIAHAFPKAQVDEYRGSDGEIVIPHRLPGEQ